MNINYTGHRSLEKLVFKKKFKTTRVGRDHWGNWLNNRRHAYIRYLDVPIVRYSYDQKVLQDYMDNLSSAVFDDFFLSGAHTNYRQGDIPLMAQPILKAFYGSQRSRYPPKYLGRQFVHQVVFKKFRDFTDEEVRLDGFSTKEEFYEALKYLNLDKLNALHGSAEIGMENHVWVQMTFCWIEGPHHVYVNKNEKHQPLSVLTIEEDRNQKRDPLSGQQIEEGS